MSKPETFSSAYRKWKKAHADIKHIDALIKSQNISNDVVIELWKERDRLAPSVEALRKNAINAPK